MAGFGGTGSHLVDSMIVCCEDEINGHCLQDTVFFTQFIFPFTTSVNHTT